MIWDPQYNTPWIAEFSNSEYNQLILQDLSHCVEFLGSNGCEKAYAPVHLSAAVLIMYVMLV